MESSTNSGVHVGRDEFEGAGEIPPVLEAIPVDAIRQEDVVLEPAILKAGMKTGPSEASDVSLEAAVPGPPRIQSPFSEFQSLDANIVTVDRIGYGILLLFVAFLGAIPSIALTFAFWGTLWVLALVYSIYLALIALVVWAGISLPARTHRSTRWRLNERGFDIRRGVWWKKEITVPRARVQHTDVHQGPLARRFGIAKLVVHTAGTHEASVELDGLSHAVATRLRDILIADEGAIRDAI